MVSKVFFVLAMLSSMPIVRIASYDLNISPVHIEVQWTVPTWVMVTCSAGVALTGCQFTWRDYWGSSGPLLDLSHGPQSRTNKAFINGSLLAYGYLGRGLSTGECGISMRLLGANLWMVGCRVSTDNTEWKYAWMDVTVSVRNKQPSTITPREVVVLPGGDARFMLKTQGALTECQWYLPGISGYINLRQGSQSPQSTGRHRYYGAGLHNGDCGVTLTNVSEADNGAVNVFAASSTGSIPYNRFIAVIVARRPRSPVLSVARNGASLTVTCLVAATLPVASITWYLDGDIIRRDARDDSPAGLRDEWRWPWVPASVLQRVTLDLDPEDDGRVVKCEVAHATLTRPDEATYTISFEERCLLLASDTVDTSCFFGGQPSNCSHPQRVGSSANLACKPGFRNNDVVSYETINCMARGVWDRPIFTCSPVPVTKTCSLLASDTVDISCFFGGQPINCSHPQRAGSSANLACKPGFLIYDVITYRTIHCTDSGEWNKPVFACSPDCGKRNSNSGQPLVAGGEIVTVGEFPWHVAVFEQDRDRSMNLICSGALISPNIVISAAHCYWSFQSDALKNASVYRVAAGKLTRAWVDAAEDASRTVQRRDVQQVFVPPGYHGRRANYQSDIALLQLASPVDITPDVNLVCVDWESRWERAQLTPGNNGSVAGWGYTEAGVLSDQLRKVDLLLVDHQTCYQAVDENMKPMLTLDKLCAGYANRSTGACRGDSGGGLVFRLAGVERHYLRGVVSLAFTPFSNRDPCYSQLYTAFTVVSHHYAWLRQHI